jgi:protein TonB
MNRLQKKCFIASLGVHVLLGLILLIGPAFLSSKANQDEMQVLDFVPAKTVDALVSGGGTPDAKPLPVQPSPQPKPVVQAPPPAPEPQPVRQPEPEPPPEPKAPDPDALLQSKESRKKKPEISTTMVTRRKDDLEKRRADAQAREQKAVTDARRRLARQIGEMAESLRDDVSGGTAIALHGPGGGGVPYANFLQSVMSAYKRAWSGTVPNDATDENVSVEASVTIARDGTVIDSQIISRSGRPAVDRSVQSVLERVKYAAPLPEGKETQRIVPITFEVSPKK